ncbi:MAG: hypothetical protein QOI59_1081 [Gammaproteobacteria bacterium]|nr:hypothetical protein [Gammaproteobacteria bacterium]
MLYGEIQRLRGDGTVPGNDAGVPVTTPFSKDPFVIN